MKARKNTVSLYSQDGMLRVRFKYKGTLIRKALGLADENIHRVKAEQIRCTIELAILADTFNLTKLDDYVFNKPLTGIDKPTAKKRYSKNSPRRKAFTNEETQLILRAFYEDTFTPKHSAFKHSHYARFVHFLFLTGCRISEAIGLQFSDIDWKAKQVHITKALARNKEGKTSGKSRVYKEPKTVAGVRSIPLNQQLADLLKAVNGKPSALVFPSYRGLAIDDHSFSQRIWRRVIDGLGIEYRVPYAIRKTRITQLIESGEIPINQISYLCGHANSKITLDTYTTNRMPKTLPDL